MRWEALFADLEAQLAAADGADGLDAEVVRAEVAQIALADRLRAHVGAPLRVVLRDGQALAGELLDAGCDWLLLAEGGARVLVPASAVSAAAGLTRAVAPPAGRVAARLGLASVLRALARDRAAVRLVLAGHVATGTIDRVGADHLDLAEHALDEPRRASAVRGVLTAPLAAVLAVRSTA